MVEKTFRPSEKCPQARIDRKDMQYLYSDGDLCHFMDVESYEQIALDPSSIGDALKFVKENEMCVITSYSIHYTKLYDFICSRLAGLYLMM